MQCPPITSLSCRCCECPDTIQVIINTNIPTDCSKCKQEFISIGTGGVPPTPADPTIVQIVTNVDGSSYVWDTVTQTWIEINPSVPSGIYAVPTVDDLRAVDDNGLLRYAIVFGNTVPGDGQTRGYWWNPNETGADDGITIIRPTSQAPGVDGAWNEL